MSTEPKRLTSDLIATVAIEAIDDRYVPPSWRVVVNAGETAADVAARIAANNPNVRVVAVYNERGGKVWSA